MNITKDTTSYIEYIFIPDTSSTTGEGLTGLVYNSAGLTASYVRAGAARTALTLATQTVSGAYSSGGFVEVDATNMPGVYRLDIPNAVFADGVKNVIVLLHGATNMPPVILRYKLTDLDDQTAMRGTDSAALASVCTEARLAELDAANLPSDVDDILTDTGTSIPADIAALNDVSSADVQSACDAAITANTDINNIDTGVNNIEAKLPNNYIMGSSVQTDKDDEIDAILTDTGTSIPALIAALNDISSADVQSACDAAVTANTDINNIDTGVNNIEAKLPNNYIMGSSVQTDKDDEIDAILTDTGTSIPADIAALNDVSSADVQSACDAAITANADINAILTDTGTTLPAAIAALNDITVADIIAGITDGTLDLQEILRIILAAVAGKTTGGGLNFRDPADTKNRIVAVVDASNNRTSMTLDGS